MAWVNLNNVFVPRAEYEDTVGSLQDSICKGEVIVPTTPGETTSYRVDFPEPLSSVPTVMVTIVSSVPERFYPPCVDTIDENGFMLHIQRSTDSATRVAWLAIL